MTSASVHDSNVFEELLDPNNSSRDVWADSAYRSEDTTNWLQSNSFREHLQRKGTRSRKFDPMGAAGKPDRSENTIPGGAYFRGPGATGR